MPESEIITIMICYHFGTYRTLKDYYIVGAKELFCFAKWAILLTNFACFGSQFGRNWFVIWAKLLRRIALNTCL